ncbi:MAG: CHRD domain-containing protein [Ignavibacteriales bacterium]|nr:CHRD domain-containing protein [Ignavibacteriales bacterium]
MKLLLLWFLVGIVLVCPAAAVAQIHFTATLSGSQEPTPVSTAASGTGSFTLNDSLTELKYTVTYQGLSGTLSAGGHFHVGPPGVNGPVVRGIASGGDPASATIFGAWRSTDAEPLTRALVESLLVGKIYVNFHTTANPGGEIRGRLALQTPLHFVASLSGGNEPSPVTTPATGSGTFVLATDMSQLDYEVSYRGLSGPLSAGGHFHVGPEGVNGPIVRNIAGGGAPAETTFTGIWSSSDGAQPLTVALVESLLAGKIYVNFHTTANPGGEIRGQLNLVGGTGFSIRLSGANEPTPVTTPGMGTGWLWLNAGRTEANYEITYYGLTGSLSAGGHFHVAPVGVNGPIVRDIATGGFPSDTTVSGSWKITDGSQPLTTALVESLLTGRIYANFHTTTNPGGEIRGEVDLETGVGFTARLDGSQEPTPVSTPATGTASVFLSPDRSQITYDITYTGLSGPLSAGGHFHSAPEGVNGPIVRDVASGGAPADTTLAGTWTTSDGMQPLTSALVDSLIAGKLYINFHTTANPGGEIRGQVRFGPDAVISSVEQVSNIVPASFRLDQNYPNPFNPSTTIRFSVPLGGKMTLKVYDLLGRVVATLLDGYKEAGEYAADFNASALTSGVYFYRLNAENGYMQTRKMVLIK